MSILCLLLQTLLISLNDIILKDILYNCKFSWELHFVDFVVKIIHKNQNIIWLTQYNH